MVFDSSVRKELSRSFGATLVVILTIVLTMLLIRTVGQAAGGQVSPQDVVLLLGYVALGYLPLMLALSLFVSIVVSLGRMYRDGEMVIWFASGVGLSRIVKPVLRASWPVLVVVAALTLVAWPWVNQNSAELRDVYAKRSDLSRVTPGVFQSSADGQRVFFIEREGADAAHARNVFILSQRNDLESVTSAQRGRIVVAANHRELVLEAGQRNDFSFADGETAVSRFEDYRLQMDEDAAQKATARPPKSMDTLQLLAQPTAARQGELAWRLGLVFGAANLLLLGIGLSATNPRRASNWNLLFALLSFIVYYNLINLTQAWVAGGQLPVGAAMVGLHGGVFAAAVALIKWREHATTWCLWPRRQSASGAA